jgi:hypothetical protein
MSLDRRDLYTPLVLVFDEDEAWEVARAHPTLKHVGKFGLSVYACVFRCVRYGGCVILFNEEYGDAGLFIVGKISRSAIEWVVPLAGLLGYKSVIFWTDRPLLERIARMLGYEKDEDGFMFKRTGV